MSDKHQLTFDLTKELPHGGENSPHCEAIYLEQMVRLNHNALIILKCLLEGQHLSGVDCQTGIKSSDMEHPVRMSEYRKRFQEIEKAGFDLDFKSNAAGVKTKFLRDGFMSPTERYHALQKLKEIEKSKKAA